MAKNNEKLGRHLKAARKVLYPVIVHELGHWLMAKKVSFETTDLQIKLGYRGDQPWAEGSATVILQIPLKDIDNTIDYLEKRIAVLCAGAHAESLIVCPDGTSIADHFSYVLNSNGISDYQKADELAALSRNILQVNTLDRSKEPLERWDQITRTMRKHQFTKSEKEILEKHAKDFSEEILGQLSQGVYPNYIFSRDRLNKILMGIPEFASAVFPPLH